jgi:hypothetical protein
VRAQSGSLAALDSEDGRAISERYRDDHAAHAGGLLELS